MGAASGAQALAAANTFADISGADIEIIRTIQSGPAVGSNGTVSSTSETQATAIDFHNFDFPGGPLVIDLTLQVPHVASGFSGGNQFALLGHLATVSADAQAFGANSISDTHTVALTDLLADNPFSFVSGLSISGVA
jgi:hypothetical protein